MPTLDWLARADALNGADRVPFRLLQPVSEHGEAGSDNLLIQGDNLHALKALLPLYRGRVKCIFIDPPYMSMDSMANLSENPAISLPAAPASRSAASYTTSRDTTVAIFLGANTGIF